jgi:hypothetical protein
MNNLANTVDIRGWAIDLSRVALFGSENGTALAIFFTTGVKLSFDYTSPVDLYRDLQRLSDRWRRGG